MDNWTSHFISLPSHLPSPISVGAPLSYFTACKNLRKGSMDIRNCKFGGGTSIFAGNSSSAVTFPFADAKVGWTWQNWGAGEIVTLVRLG